MRIATEAWPFVLPFAVLALVLWLYQRPWWAAAALGLALLVALFFRDPARRYDGPEEIVLAPADGLVTRVDVVEEPRVGPGRWRRVVTFLSVFDVHVQRSPAEGEVVHTEHTRGRKVAAFRADADRLNESHLTVLERPNGDRLGVFQIAGLLARRVVPYLRRSDRVSRGDHLGLIKFGSRVDLLVPDSYEVLVERGDRLKAGLTPVAMPTDPSSPPPELERDGGAAARP